MNRGPRRSTAVVLVAACVFGVLVFWARSHALGAPAIVGVVAPRESRLADDLRRELEASRFVVVSVEATTGDWRSDARRLPGTQVLHGVVVRGDDQLMTVFTRPVPAAPPAVASNGQSAFVQKFEQKVESGDRLARRRACMGVVEYLRVLIEHDAPASIDLTLTSPAAGRMSPSPSPSPPPSPSPSPSPSQSSSPAAASVQAISASPAQKEPVPSGKPATSPAPPSHVTASATPPATVPVETTIANSTQESPASGAARFWELGLGTTLGLNTAPGGPTAHLQFLWYLPLDWRLAVCIRGFWPVVGGQFRAGGNEVRTWAFGGAASMQYLFELGPTRLQPFIGASLGTRVALTETSPLEGLQSRKTFTPSVYLGADAGARYVLSPRVKLFFEVGLAHGWLIPGIRRLDYEGKAAAADSFHATFGILFEI